MNEEITLVPYAIPEKRYGDVGDWWALAKVEQSVQNPDGSRRTFSVEVGLSLKPHGDYLHVEKDFWRLVAEKLPLIADQLAPTS